jgi:hypothetical protein
MNPVINTVLHKVSAQAYPENIIPIMLRAKVFNKLNLLRTFQDIQIMQEQECHHTL